MISGALLLWAFPVFGWNHPHQSLSLRSADGTELKVWLSHPPGVWHDSPRPVVIALHGCAVRLVGHAMGS
ncbi:MAG: hypothetical protein EBU75_04060 [Betaproteobacteria bacterium]|nr:hypothetical protein [Betaproteobacteria bacterium]